MDKRDFLKTVIGGVASAAIILVDNTAMAKKYAISLSKLTKLNEVGGSVIIKLGDKQIILVRVSKDHIKGFSAICTHHNCLVGYDKKNNRINCNCHGSYFDMSGKAKKGPAQKPLKEYPVKIDGNRIIVG